MPPFVQNILLQLTFGHLQILETRLVGHLVSGFILQPSKLKADSCTVFHNFQFQNTTFYYKPDKICVAQKMGFTERRKSPSPEIIKSCKKIVGKLITTANSHSAKVLLFNNHSKH